MTLSRPDASEYAPFYAGYVSRVPEGDVLDLLEHQLDDTLEVVERVKARGEEYRYAPGKWSVRDVVGHLADVERLFGFRALAFARSDPGPFPGMDENGWARASNAGSRPLADLVGEWRRARSANLALFRSFDAGIGMRRGVASGVEFTVRAIPWILAGHERHHRAVLEERYLGGAS